MICSFFVQSLSILRHSFPLHHLLFLTLLRCLLIFWILHCFKVYFPPSSNGFSSAFPRFLSWLFYSYLPFLGCVTLSALFFFNPLPLLLFSFVIQLREVTFSSLLRGFCKAGDCEALCCNVIVFVAIGTARTADDASKETVSNTDITDKNTFFFWSILIVLRAVGTGLCSLCEKSRRDQCTEVFMSSSAWARMIGRWRGGGSCSAVLFPFFVSNKPQSARNLLLFVFALSPGVIYINLCFLLSFAQTVCSSKSSFLMPFLNIYFLEFTKIISVRSFLVLKV